MWDTSIRKDTAPLTTQKLRAIEMTGQQKAVHQGRCKGFVGVHSAATTFTDWPEFGDMIGGVFDEHPWDTFDAPIVVEDPAFWACRNGLPRSH